jgi:hypothetical protein
MAAIRLFAAMGRSYNSLSRLPRHLENAHKQAIKRSPLHLAGAILQP